jgi:hypothetical protein
MCPRAVTSTHSKIAARLAVAPYHFFAPSFFSFHRETAAARSHAALRLLGM